MPGETHVTHDTHDTHDTHRREVPDASRDEVPRHEPHETDDEAERRVEDLARPARDRLRAESERGAIQLEDLNVSLRTMVADSSQVTGLDALDATYVRSVDDSIRNDGPAPRSEAQGELARQRRAEDIAFVERHRRVVTRTKGIAVLIGVVALAEGAFTAVITYLMYEQGLEDKDPEDKDPEDTGGEGDAPDRSGLTPAQKEQLKKQVTRWRALPDAAMWEQVATYCDDWNPSWDAQTLLMDEIKRLAGPMPPWTWRGDDDADEVDALVEAYAKFEPGTHQHRSSIIYRTVAEVRYDGVEVGSPVAIPRVAAADLAERCIPQILVREDASAR